MSNWDPFGRWKQRTYPWVSDAPATAEHVDGRPARSHFWVIPTLFVALVVIFVLLAVFSPSDAPPDNPAEGQSIQLDVTTPVAPSRSA